MSNPNSFWIMTTFGAGALAVLFMLIDVALWYFARKEGRHFIKRGFGGGGVDLIRHEPLSNKISLTNLKWDKGIWKLGKEAMFFGLDKLLNPESAEDHLYNKLISESSTWDGSKRPAVIATDIVSFTITPALYAAIAKAENAEKYGEAKKLLKSLNIPMSDNPGVPLIEKVSFLEIIQPETLKKYLKDLGPKKMREMFLKGVEAQKLANTRPPTEGKFGGAIVPILIGALVLGVIVGVMLIKSGVLKGFI